MEAAISDKLRLYGSARMLALDATFRVIPKNVSGHNAVFHTLILFCTGSIIAAIFTTIRKLSLFSLHPTCMTIGAILFLGEGIVSYRNNTLLEILSPIMQRDKKTKVRAIHQTLQTGGALFIALGMLFIVAHKLEYNKSIVPASIHSIMGSVVLLLIAVQVISGRDKVAQLESSNRRVRRWHGDAGLLLWDLLCLTILLGLLSFLSLSFATFLVVLSVLGVWLAVHTQMLTRASIHKYDSSNSMDDCPVAGFATSNNNNSSNLGLVRNDSFGNVDVDVEAASSSMPAADDSDRLIGEHDGMSQEVAHDYDN